MNVGRAMMIKSDGSGLRSCSCSIIRSDELLRAWCEQSLPASCNSRASSASKPLRKTSFWPPASRLQQGSSLRFSTRPQPAHSFRCTASISNCRGFCQTFCKAGRRCPEYVRRRKLKLHPSIMSTLFGGKRRFGECFFLSKRPHLQVTVTVSFFKIRLLFVFDA